MKALLLMIAVCASLAFVACGDDDSTDATGSATTATEATDSETTEGQDSGETEDGEESAEDGDDSAEDGEDSAEDGKDSVEWGGKPGTAPGKTKPTVEVPEGPPPTELVVNDIEEGDGEEIGEKDKISVAYVGVTVKDGKEFESTWDGKAPYEFTMDGGELIEGWEQGMEGMKVGGRRELIVPSKLGYKTGALVYVVDLVGIK